MRVVNTFGIVLIAVVVVGVTAWSLVSYAGLQASLIWTALLGAAAWAIRSNIEQKREHQRLLAEKKREHYLQFLEFLAPVLKHQKNQGEGNATPDDSDSAEVISLDELRLWSLRLTLIGSDEVVRTWNAARCGGLSDDDSANGIGALRNWGKLWLAMRKDCGHLDTDLNVSDVLGTFVNDIHQHKAEVDD